MVVVDAEMPEPCVAVSAACKRMSLYDMASTWQIVLPALTTGGFTILGVVVTRLFDRSRLHAEWEHGLAEKLIERRQIAYSTYATLIKRELQNARRAAAGQGAAWSDHPLTREDALMAHDQLRQSRSDALENVLLIGSPETIVAAREWTAAVHGVYAKSIDVQNPITTSEFNELYGLAMRTRDSFMDSARVDIEVAGTAQWPAARVSVPLNGAT